MKENYNKKLTYKNLLTQVITNFKKSIYFPNKFSFYENFQKSNI